MTEKSNNHTSSVLSWNSDINIITHNKINVNIVELHERYFSFHHIIITEFHERGTVIMQMNEAIIKRINEICEEKKINICDASLKGGMSPSAIYDLIKGRTKCSKVITVKRFCEGAGITLSEFFDREYFNEIEE